MSFPSPHMFSFSFLSVLTIQNGFLRVCCFYICCFVFCIYIFIIILLLLFVIQPGVSLSSSSPNTIRETVRF